MEYFSLLPKILYPYKGKIVGRKTDKIEYIECSDIMIRFKVRDEVSNNPLAVYEYNWRDGDRPDLVAANYYGDASLAWLVLVSGNLYDWYGDLPKDTETFFSYIDKKYGTLQTASQTVHHYEDGDGYIIDLLSYQSIVDADKRIVYCIDYEQEENDKKRVVKLISKTYTKQLKTDFERQIRNIVDARKLSEKIK